MGIADELRGFAHSGMSAMECSAYSDKLIDIADRIDKTHEEEHAYAYEAGYRDGSINYELEFCPACKNVADLQEALAENAKLRKLVSGLEYCSQGFACDSCPLYDPSGTNHHRCESLERELGVGVDE